MRKIRGVALVVLGLCLCFSAAGMFADFEEQDAIAGENAQLLLTGLRQELEQQRQPQTAAIPAPREEPAPGEMPQITLIGYGLVGSLAVPVLELELPVLEGWSYDLLKLAPCRYSGSAAGGDLILLAHNYKRHFGTLKQLEVGDSLSFSDVDGRTYTYRVAATEVLQKTELERLTGSDCDLTLFTCTQGGYSRFVVRCSLTDTDESAYTSFPENT